MRTTGAIESFSIPFGSSELKGDVCRIGDDKLKILFLHGAGTSNRKRYKSLQEFLMEYGEGSCVFDFIGHGETGGDLSKSTLSERTAQALKVIEAQKIATPLILVGASMGAYTAVKISNVKEVGKLILFVPAMYSSEAYDIPFDDRFSHIIRKEKSWLESDAWSILSNFKGELLVIQAGQDDVIPKELVDKVFESTQTAKKKELYVVPDAPHRILRYLDEHPGERKQVFDKILNFIK